MPRSSNDRGATPNVMNWRRIRIVAALSIAVFAAIPTCGLAWEAPATRAIDPVALERQTIEIAPRIQAATVGVVLSEDDTDAGIGYGGSGVIVSADGLVLTAAHVLEGCGDEVLVVLPESRHVKARVCGYLGRGDLAVLELTDKGPWPFLPMADVKKVAPGTFCVGAGHTGRIDPQRPPPVRMGRVLGERQGESFVDENGDAADLDRVLVSDAPFLPGDSGGPLVNLDGEVIGIHSSIGPDHRENLHVPIWQFRRHWAKLTGGVKRPLPRTTADELLLSELIHMGPLRRLPIFDYRIAVERSWSTTHPNHLKRFASISQKLASPPVQVFADDRAVALGCAVAKDVVVSVATSISQGKLVCRVDGKDYDAALVARDEAHNLALLRIHGAELHPIEWSAAVPSVGAWLVSPGVHAPPQAVSIVSLPCRDVPEPKESPDPLATHGFLGVELQDRAMEARISRVLSNSAAAAAGLSGDDVIHRINEHVIERGEQLIQTLRRFKPEEQIKLEISRGDMKMQLDVTLGRRPSQQQEDDAEFATWNRSGGGVSLRKTNLPNVLTHDGCVSPKHCGGPVLDLQGRVVGLNIARADRTSTYALSADAVKHAVEKMLDEVAAKSER
jgi:serine protease Do